MHSPDYSISTPENVDLHIELAGMGNRVLACLIDTTITYAVIILLWLLAWGMCTLVGMGSLPVQATAFACGIILLITLLLSFTVLFFYYIVFEGFWQGQTPGKRVAQIRVIDQNGQPINWSAVWLRNFLRFVDMGLFFVGLIFMVIDKNERRMGDFAAGTLVIRERLPNLGIEVSVSPAAKEGAMLLDVGRISPQEYELLTSFLKRREKMSKSERPLVARDLEEHFRNKLGEPPDAQHNSELFLEKIYTAYQSRAE